MDAIKFLLKEHNKIRSAFKNIKKSIKLETKQKLFSILAKKLVIHETMEQKKWYPSLKKEINDNKLIKHLVSEEKSAAKAIKRLKKVKSETTWINQCNELNQDVEHHASQEENELFPIVLENLEKQKLIKLGETLNQFKKQHEKGLNNKKIKRKSGKHTKHPRKSQSSVLNIFTW